MPLPIVVPSRGWPIRLAVLERKLLVLLTVSVPTHIRPMYHSTPVDLFKTPLSIVVPPRGWPIRLAVLERKLLVLLTVLVPRPHRTFSLPFFSVSFVTLLTVLVPPDFKAVLLTSLKLLKCI